MKKKGYLIIGFILGFIGIGIGAFALLSNSISLQASVNQKDNAVDLAWQEPDNDEPYTYKVFQKKEGSSEFQSISTANLKNKVKVLSIYPGTGTTETYINSDGKSVTIEKSGLLEKWMEEPNTDHPNGYGMGLIEVDNVKLTEFNANPSSYLKNADGTWKYDTVFFGSWDLNGVVDMNDASQKLVAQFIESGRGALFGHDTITEYRNPVFFQKMKSYANIKTYPYVNNTYSPNDLYINMPWIGGEYVTIKKPGLLISYPWKVGEVGDKLTIPYSHTNSQIAYGDIWMEFDEDNLSSPWSKVKITKDRITTDENGMGTNNHYLSTWSNTAMIQTGHSQGEATPDEQKVLANTLFYLSQLTTDTSIKDRSGMDVAPPDKIKSISYDNKTNTVSFSTPKDNGSTYEYYVEAKGQDTGKVKKSSTERIANTSGLAGYSYVVDDKQETDPDNTVYETTSTFQIDLSKATGNMLHIKAIDKAGNSSEVSHVKLDLLKLTSSINHETNSIELNWNDMPDGSQPYTYKIFQNKGGSEVFYLSQLTTETEMNDPSGMDLMPPTKVSNVKVSLENYQRATFSYGESPDQGSTYKYYVQATGQSDGRAFKSNVIVLENKSGLNGYSIVVDTKSDTMPDNTIETTDTNLSVKFPVNQGYYIHIAAVDKAGNKSVVHYKVEKPELIITSSTGEWTNQGVPLTVTAKGFGIEKIKLPNGSVKSGTTATYTATESGDYTFYGLTKNGEILVVKSIVVANIDHEGKEALIIPGDENWRNKDIQVQINTKN